MWKLTEYLKKCYLVLHNKSFYMEMDDKNMATKRSNKCINIFFKASNFLAVLIKHEKKFYIKECP